MLDLYTIRDLFGQVDDLRIAFVGDIAHGRTVRSLTYLLAHLQGNRLYFVSPPELGLTDEMRQYLQERGVTFSDHEDVDEVIGKVDVLYVTRLQWERVEDEDRRQHLISDYKRHQITWERADRMKGGSVLMHPLPINTERSNGYPEIASEVDYHPRAHYFRQSNNGLYVRMALLDILLRPERELCNLILDVT